MEKWVNGSLRTACGDVKVSLLKPDHGRIIEFADGLPAGSVLNETEPANTSPGQADQAGAKRTVMQAIMDVDSSSARFEFARGDGLDRNKQVVQPPGTR